MKYTSFTKIFLFFKIIPQNIDAYVYSLHTSLKIPSWKKWGFAFAAIHKEATSTSTVSWN